MAANTSNVGKKIRSGRPGADIVTTDTAQVKEETAAEPLPRKRGRPGRPKTRRQSHGSAWHWKQTDSWYYTLPGTKWLSEKPG